jgi:hypothetical protein
MTTHSISSLQPCQLERNEYRSYLGRVMKPASAIYQHSQPPDTRRRTVHSDRRCIPDLFVKVQKQQNGRNYHAIHTRWSCPYACAGFISQKRQKGMKRRVVLAVVELTRL